MSEVRVLPGATFHEGSSGEPAALAETLASAARAFDRSDVPYLLIGGLASALLGRPRCSSDIDLFVAPEVAPRALDVLAADGFTTEIVNPQWLYKAFRGGVLLDLMFKMVGDIYLDAEMLRRAKHYAFLDTRVRVIPPEDLLVIKAIVHDEETPRHWHDALALLHRNEMDWDYLVERARRGPRRVLALLCYALSSDLCVPLEPVRRLSELVLE